MRAARRDGVVCALAVSPATLLVVRGVATRLSPPADPRAIVDMERAALPGQVLVTLFATALLATGLVALAGRRGARTERWLWGSFAVGAVAAALGAVVLR